MATGTSVGHGLRGWLGAAPARVLVVLGLVALVGSGLDMGGSGSLAPVGSVAAGSGAQVATPTPGGGGPPAPGGTGGAGPALRNGEPADLVLGQPDFTSRREAAGANGLAEPSGVAIGRSGKVFVADSPNRRVLRYAALADLSQGAPAEAVLGQVDFASHNGAATASGLAGPEGVAVDAQDRLWVADARNNRVLRFDGATTKANGAAADGVLGQPDFTSSAAATTASGLRGPAGLAVDMQGRLWVVDSGNHRVLRFDQAAGKANGAPADGVLGQGSFTSNNPSDDPAGMAMPWGVAVESGRLWVADSGNNRLLRYEDAARQPDGARASTVLGGHRGNSPGEFSGPRGVAATAGDRLWVADTGNHRVLWFDRASRDSRNAVADGVLGQSDLTSRAPATTQSGLNGPVAVAVGPNGGPWVADAGNHRVMHYGRAVAAATPTAMPTAQAPAAPPPTRVPPAIHSGQPAALVVGQPDFTSLSQQTAAMGLAGPSGISVDLESGKVFVADTANNRVLRFPALAAGAPAEAVFGQPDFTSSAAATSRTGLNSPRGVFILAGSLWVADTGNNRVLRFDMAADKSSGAPADGVLGQPDFTSVWIGLTIGATDLPNPVGLFEDVKLHLWVADPRTRRVLRFDNARTKPNGAPADGLLGAPYFSSNPMDWGPTGVTGDQNGRLWVADAAKNRVLRFDDAATKPDGAPADGVLGQSDLTSSAAGAGQRGLNSPLGVAADTYGRLWVADTQNNRLLWFDTAATKPNGAPADGVLGQTDFDGTAPATSQSGLNAPRAVATDFRTGQPWVADTNNSRVMRFIGITGLPADSVLGQANFNSNQSPVHPGQGSLLFNLSIPYGVAVDPTTGKLFVADTVNNRVLRFAAVAVARVGGPPESVFGQADVDVDNFAAYASTGRTGLNQPLGLAVDQGGTLWVADTKNNRVMRWDNAATKPPYAPADGVLGQPNFTSNGAGLQGGMNRPSAVSLAATGPSGDVLFVADTGNGRVLRFKGALQVPNGGPADGVFGAPNLNTEGQLSASAVAVDNDINIWVADRANNRVLYFKDAWSKADGAPADAVLGQADLNGTAAATNRTGLNLPGGLAYQPNTLDAGSDGRLWVADTWNHRVLWFDNVKSKPNGAGADGVLGQSDFSNHDPTLGQSGLNAPAGLSVDYTGHIWVADSANNRVLRYTIAP